PCWPQAPEIPGESGPARNSDEIRKRRKAQEMRVPDPMAHDFGLGSDFFEASTPGGRAVRRADEPSETFGCPANWTAERCFLRRCYRNPILARVICPDRTNLRSDRPASDSSGNLRPEAQRVRLRTVGSE